MIKTLIKRKKALIYLFLSLGVIVYSSFYIKSKFLVFNDSIDVIRIELNEKALEKGVPIMYTNKNHGAKIDFAKVYRFVKVDDRIVEIRNLKKDNLSNFRIYFEFPGKAFYMENITVSNDTDQRTISLGDIKLKKGIKINSEHDFDVTQSNGYIEYPKIIVSSIPYTKIIISVLLLSLLTGLIINKTELLSDLFKAKKKDYIFIAYLFSIFSFAPIYNVMLILSLLYYIRKFSWKIFIENKINILFVSLFLVYFLNTFFLKENEIRDFSIVEKLLPLFFIPVLMASARLNNAMYYLMLSALFIGLVLITTSIIDFILLQNYEYFSFATFSKYYHPVYLSYLIFLTLCFLQQYYNGKGKHLLQLILLVLLIFLGSKLVILVSIPLFSMFFLNIKKRSIYFIALNVIFLVSIFLFKPLQQRFGEILKWDALTLLNEDHVQDDNDPRINGLTFRLILWRESLKTLNGFNEFAFGNGVTKSKSRELENRLIHLGLINHKSYNPHNQFLDTFWRTGAIGLLVLILIFAFAINKGLNSNNKVLIIFAVFILFCCFTESVFGRVRGVYFITTALLILTNSNFSYKKEILY